MRYFVIIVALLFTFGCGQKGALYQPKQTTDAPQSSSKARAAKDEGKSVAEKVEPGNLQPENKNKNAEKEQ